MLHPEVLVLLLQYDGHSVVDRGHKVVRRCGEDYERGDDQAVRRTPSVIKSSEAQIFSSLGGYEIRLLALIGLHPFIKTGRWHQAAMADHEAFEHRFFHDRLGTGVDKLQSGALGLGPGRDEAPVHHLQVVRALPYDYRDILGGGDVESWLHDLTGLIHLESSVKAVGEGDDESAAHR